MANPPEIWLRGPIHGIPHLLGPVAHALVQAREDVASSVAGVTREALWMRPNGAASAGFHLFHAAHALDRLMTYARGESLQDEQLHALARERSGDLDGNSADLIRLVEATVDRALRQLRCTPEASLLSERRVGRGEHPSTVLGLLFHAAEHTTRHTGQVITTLKIVSGTRVPT